MTPATERPQSQWITVAILVAAIIAGGLVAIAERDPGALVCVLLFYLVFTLFYSWLAWLLGWPRVVWGAADIVGFVLSFLARNA